MGTVAGAPVTVTVMPLTAFEIVVAKLEAETAAETPAAVAVLVLIVPM